jgi:hypothetical protein
LPTSLRGSRLGSAGQRTRLRADEDRRCTLLSELYPTEARATAENVIFNMGRGVGGFRPFVVGALAASYSFEVAIALLATIYLLDIAVTASLIPEKIGAPLE